ncbi:MAG: cytochrome c biogenesis protein CcdA [Dehalococcoidia bacterium]|nr:cytochrome c biogenesis protein CcdA [Dehalococcoidia bacterium]
MILPMGYAFGAGMVSAVNPCGFPLLAPYLGLYLNDRKGPATRGRTRQLTHALLVGGAVTAGFVALFTVAGLIIGGGSRALVDAFPWIGLTVGVALVAGGAWMLGGRPIYGALGEQLAARIGDMGDPGKASIRGYVLFGLSYGTASLSCTLPIFLTVVGSSLTLTDAPGAATQFVLYGLGMGSVITALTLSMAVMKAAMVTGIRRILPYMEHLSAGLLLLAGAYLVYYWLTVSDLLDRLS